METEEKIKLTAFSRGAGCGCKIAPQVLEEMLMTEESNREFTNLPSR